MTNARQRTLYGRTTPAVASRFLNEIPEANSEWLSKPEPRPAPARWDDWSDDGSAVSYVPVQQRTGAPKKTMEEAGGAVRRPAASAAPLMKIQPGESVSHDAFGKGMVLSVRPMGNDALIEVAFDKVGTKKLMLKAAGSHLKKL